MQTFLLTTGLVREQTSTRTSKTLIKYMATVHSHRSGACCVSFVGETKLEMCESPAASGGGTLEQGETHAKA